MRRLKFGLMLALPLLVAAPAPAAQLRPGVTTHFSQGWPAPLMGKAAELGTGTIRDSLHWAAVETSPSSYSFTDKNSGHIARACAAGMNVLLGIDPRNRIYDGGFTAHSPEAQAAFANYILTIATRYQGCVIGIEIGNEINGRNNVTGPAATKRIASHVALLKAVHGRVKPSHPELKLIGGSTNSIATGFLTRLITAGMLDYVDGVAVHPYRNAPEVVDWELARLTAAMQRKGKVKPIWATEFSREFTNPADAAPFYLKMIALMETSGAEQHFWYALIDQTWFPTMGLLTLSGEPKPASRAYSFAAARLAPLGPAVRIDHGDPTLFHFRFGTGADVIWGAPRSLVVSGAAQTYRADGTPIALRGGVTDDPVVIIGASSVGFGEAQILADSLYGFAQSPLSWFGRNDTTGALVPLAPIDWQWTSYLGSKVAPRIIVNPEGIGPALRASAIVRYTADRPGDLIASLCLLPLGSSGDGTTAALTHNGQTIWTAPVGPLTGKRTASAAVSVKSGDRVEFILSPKAAPAGDRMHYRFRMSRSSADAATC